MANFDRTFKKGPLSVSAQDFNRGMFDALIVLAEAQHGVISLAQAMEAGLSRKQIAGRVARGDLEVLFPGALRLAGSPRTFEQRIMAGVLAAGAGAVASHRAAATLLGYPGVPRWVEVLVPNQRRVRLDGLFVHRTRTLPPSDVACVRGIPVTSGARTLIDLAGAYSRERLGRLLDHGLVNRLCTRAGIEARLELLGPAGRPGSGVLRELLAERPDNGRPMGSDFEADLFAALTAAGLPRPASQHRVLLPDGAEVFLDFAYPELRLAIEADSYVWHASKEAWERDRMRNSDLVALGWSILPVTWRWVQRCPSAVARKVASSLASRSV